MNLARGTRFELARVTIEFRTPMRVGAGGWDPLHDAFFVTDANGLPALPGSSIAGALRHAAADAWGEADAVRAVFGFQQRTDGRASRLEVSWGQVHGNKDHPVPFLGADQADDEVLAFLSAGVIRDHVRIDARGTADDRGKFDELMVPAGARFTFELVLHEGSERSMADVLSLLIRPSMRLGAGSRKGLGRFEVVRAAGRRFDLTDPSSRQAFGRLPRGLHEPVSDGVFEELSIDSPSGGDRWRTGTLVLEPTDFWMIGRGDPHRPEHERRQAGSDRVQYVDIVPAEARRVVWEDGQGKLTEPEPTVPASAIKGALRHRVAYHARRAGGEFWSEGLEAGGGVTAADRVAEVNDLFGTIRDEDEGQPGRLLLSDGRATKYRWGRLDHVSLDRFTQGQVDHLLFSEAPLYGGQIELELAVDTQGLGDAPREALRQALDDLCHQRLSIGAGGSRGHGHCHGRIEWSGGRGLDA